MEAIAFDDIRRVMQGVTPPPEMEAFHESLVEATRLSAHAYRVISDGLYQNDVAGIERGFEILGEAADLYHEAADLMTTLTSP